MKKWQKWTYEKKPITRSPEYIYKANDPADELIKFLTKNNIDDFIILEYSFTRVKIIFTK